MEQGNVQAAGAIILWDENELAAKLKIAVSTLQKQRMNGDGIPFLKMGRLVRYSPSAVAAYLDGCVVNSTSQARAA